MVDKRSVCLSTTPCLEARKIRLNLDFSGEFLRIKRKSSRKFLESQKSGVKYNPDQPELYFYFRSTEKCDLRTTLFSANKFIFYQHSFYIQNHRLPVEKGDFRNRPFNGRKFSSQVGDIRT